MAYVAPFVGSGRAVYVLVAFVVVVLIVFTLWKQIGFMSSQRHRLCIVFIDFFATRNTTYYTQCEVMCDLVLRDLLLMRHNVYNVYSAMAVVIGKQLKHEGKNKEHLIISQFFYNLIHFISVSFSLFVVFIRYYFFFALLLYFLLFCYIIFKLYLIIFCLFILFYLIFV